MKRRGTILQHHRLPFTGIVAPFVRQGKVFLVAACSHVGLIWAPATWQTNLTRLIAELQVVADLVVFRILFGWAGRGGWRERVSVYRLGSSRHTSN